MAREEIFPQVVARVGAWWKLLLYDFKDEFDSMIAPRDGSSALVCVELSRVSSNYSEGAYANPYDPHSK